MRTRFSLDADLHLTTVDTAAVRGDDADLEMRLDPALVGESSVTGDRSGLHGGRSDAKSAAVIRAYGHTVLEAPPGAARPSQSRAGWSSTRGRKVNATGTVSLPARLARTGP